MTQLVNEDNFSAGEVGKQINVGLLGFKMAVNDSLTVFNLVDGVVDEFHDESGTDEGEGSNDTYCATSDNYINTVTTPAAISAGFTTTTVTEADTSTAGANPYGNGYYRCGPVPSAQATCASKRKGSAATFGQFTVPTGMTSLNMQVWGAAGGTTNKPCSSGGGGGYAEGTLAVTASQVLYISAGEGGYAYGCGSGPAGVGSNSGGYISFFGGGEGGGGTGNGGGGLAGVLSVADNDLDSAPEAYLIAGAGGGGGYGGGSQSPKPAIAGTGGGAGGATGYAGAGGGAQNSENVYAGGGGSQTAGGLGGDMNNPNINEAPQADQRGHNAPAETGSPYEGREGGLFYGGEAAQFSGGGGSGYYGGGGGGFGGSGSAIVDAGGGGGSSYFGHPQITSGSTEDSNGLESGGATQPGYVADTGEALSAPSSPLSPGEDGFVLLTGTATTTTTSSTTIVSNAFTASSAPSTSRIVVFQENVGSPTLNTDLIASVSRDGGTTFTTITLADEGYIAGSSGQRILSGVATISGQPSGTSMRWKLALANNQSKIHGVSLSWA